MQVVSCFGFVEKQLARTWARNTWIPKARLKCRVVFPAGHTSCAPTLFVISVWVKPLTAPPEMVGGAWNAPSPNTLG